MFKYFIPLTIALLFSNIAFTQIEINFPNVSGTCGSTIDIPVTVNNFNNVFAAQFSVEWDTDVLQHNGQTVVGLPQIFNFGTSQLSNGRLGFSWFDGNASGETLMDGDTLFFINFTVLGGASGSSLTFGNSPTTIEFGGLGGGVIPSTQNPGTFTVIDTFDPTFSQCPGSQTVTAPSGSNSAVVPFISAIASDNCVLNTLTYNLTGATTGTGNDASGTAFNTGVTTVTYTATDFVGNSNNSCTFDITVIGTGTTPITLTPTDEDASCPGSSFTLDILADNFTDINVLQFSINWDPTRIQFNNTSNLSGQLSNATFGTSSTGSGILTFSWIDGMGNGENLSNGSTLFSIDFTSIATFGSSPVTVSSNTLGIFAEDTSGNQVSVNTNFGTIIGLDTENPVVGGCPADVTINNTPGTCTGSATWTTPTPTDNCSIASFTSTHNSGATFPFGPTTVTYTAVDDSNNSGSCSFIITVVDNENPVVNCPANVNVDVPAGTMSTIVNGLLPLSSNDNCGISSTTYSLTGATTNVGTNDASGNSFNVGTTNLTYTVMDNSGNTGTCSSTITVTQTIPPSNDTLTAFVRPISVECDDTNFNVSIALNNVDDITRLQFTINWDPAVLQFNGATNLILPQIFGFGTNQTGNGILTFTWDELTTTPQNYPNGTDIISIDFTLLAPIGTTSVISFSGTPASIIAETEFGIPVPIKLEGTTFKVEDFSGPTFTSCPASFTINNDPGNCIGFPNWNNIMATDNCDNNVTITGTHDAGDPFPIGTTRVTFTAVDASENSTICIFDVTVIEDEDPVVTCPTNVNMTVPTGTTSTIVNSIAPISSTDNCGVVSTSFVVTGATSINGNNDVSGSNFNVGTSNVTYQVNDASGNSGTCTFSVIIVEDMPPGPTGDTLGIYINPLMVECDDTDVSIDIGLVNVEDLTSLQFTVEWDPAVFNYNNATSLIFPPTTNFGVTQTANGRLTFSWFGAGTGPGAVVNYPDSTLIVNLDLTLLAGVGVISSIDITSGITVIEAATIGGVPIPVNVFGTGIMVTDSDAPTFTSCPSNIQVNSTLDLCSGTANWTTPTATDNCDNDVSISGNFNSGDTFPVGTTTVTYTAADDSGNTDTCNFTVEVTDNQNPTIQNCPANIILPTDAGLCSTVVTWTPPTLNDNCMMGASIASSHLPGTIFPTGTTMVTYTAIDASNNTALPCNFNVTINDTEDPTIVCPADTTILIPFGTSMTAVSGIAPISFNDNCINLMQTFNITGTTTGSGINDASGTTFNLGNSIVTYTTIDNEGNDASCAFNVSVFEENPGGILTVIAENDTVDCSASTVTIDFVVEEFTNIGSLQFSANWDNTVLQYVSNTTSTLPATAGIGVAQVANGIITYSWFDADGTTETFPDGSVIFSLNFNVIGSLNSNSIIFINDNPTPVEGGTFNGVPIDVFTVDGSFVVSDFNPPVITGCPTDFTVSNEVGQCGAAVTWTEPTATDECSNFTSSSTHAPGDFFPVGSTTVTYTYTDDFGNISTCDFVVEVTDNELPIFTNCPGNITQANDPGICAASVFWPTINLNDNCMNSATTFTHSPGFIFPLGTTTVTYTATEPGSNNTAVCSFDVTVTDTEDPMISCMSDTTIIVPFGMNSAIVNNIPPAGNGDNCGIVDVTYELTGATSGTGNMDASGISYNEGTTVVTYTGADQSGNTASCNFNVIVIEQNPGNTLTVIAENDTLNCDAQFVTIDFNVENFTDIGSLQFSVNWDPNVIQYTGNSLFNLPPNTGVGITQVANGILTFSWFDSDGSTETFPDGTQIMSLSFSVVGALNSSTIIAINDNTTLIEASTFNGTQVPVFTTDGSFVLSDLAGPFISNCPSTDISVSNDPGVCEAAVTWTVPTATDECSNVSTTASHVPGDVFPVGMTTVTYEFTDEFGNMSTCSFNVIVTDDEDPVITNCPNDIMVNTDQNACTAVVNWTNPTATDNCGNVNFNCSNNPGDTFQLGTTFVSCTASDDDGNVSLCSFQVTVIDNQDPTLTCPGDMTININSGVGSTVVDNIAPIGGGDNCMSSPITYLLAGATSSFGNADASGETFNVGVTTVTYTISDASGNTTTCSFDVEVIELFPPGTPTFTVEDNTIDCGASSVTVDILVTDFTNITDFQYTIEWDESQLSFNGILGNNLPPTSSFGTSQISAGVLTHSWASGNINGSTLPNGIIYSLNFNVIGTFNSTDVLLTGSVLPIDANGPGNVPVSINTVDGTITFDDSSAPVFAGCPTNISESALQGTCQTPVSWIEPTATDDCSVIDLVQTHSPGDIFPVGTTMVSYTATDGFGNVTTCEFNVTIIDNQPPQIICPGNIDADPDPNNMLCGNFVTWPGVEVSDNCGSASIASVTSTHNSADFFPIGVTTVVFTATDTDGMSTSCSFTVSIVDDTTPAIACPDNITEAIDPALNGAIVTWTPAFGSDNCPFDLTCTSNPGDFFSPGTTVVVCNIVDENGNANSCNFTVTVTDCDQPVFDNCPMDIEVNNDPGVCGAIVTWPDIELNETCAVGGLNCSHESGDLFPVGTTLVNCTAQDVNGNTVACVFNVTVIDNEAPVFTSCPDDITVDALDCSAIVTWIHPGTSDNCAVADTISSHNSGDAFSIGSPTMVNFAIRDDNANIDFCSFSVTVEDNTAPVFTTCPADVTLAATGPACTAVYTWDEPIAVDNCSLSSLVSSHSSGDDFPIGTTTVTYTATDASGNAEICSFVVTVTNNVTPSLACQTVQANDLNGNCEEVVNWPNIVNGGDCNNVTLICTQDSGDTFPVGTTAVSCTLENDNGVVIDNCTFNVLVTDISNPVLNGCPNNITVDTDPGVCTALVNWALPTATDGCGIDSLTSNANPGDVFNVGATLVTYTATDVNGLTETCAFNIIVEDNIAPTVTNCPVDFTINPGTGNCGDGAIVDFTPPTFSDNCDMNLLITNNISPGDTLDVGVTNITYSAMDDDGNTITCSFNVTVEDGGMSNITIIANPSDSICLGTLVVLGTQIDPTTVDTYLWTGPSAFTSGAATPVIPNFQLANEGVYTLLVTFLNGCTATGSVTLTGIDDDPLDFTVSVFPGDSLICEFPGQTLTFSTSLDTSEYTNLFWITPSGDMITASELQVLDVVNADAGTYTAVAETASGCSSSATQDVVISIVPPAPTISGIPDGNVICFGESFTLSATSSVPLGPDDHFNWASEPMGVCAGLPSLTDQPTAFIQPICPGTYIFWSSVLIDGCLSELEEIVITVLDIPEPQDDDFNAEFESTLFGFNVVLNDSLDVNEQGIFDISINTDVSNGTLINNGDGTFDYTPNQGFIGTDQFIYEICFDECGENFCGFAIVTITTTFDNGCPVPTVITPNGDGLNDELFIPCVEGGQFENNRLIIFNEWGDEVFRAEPYNNDWQGTYNDEPVPDGTYFYIFRLEDNTEETKGYITILR